MVACLGILLRVGDPKKTERFKYPPTNVQENYTPGILKLSGDSVLQEWMFKDFNYAAWLRVKGTIPWRTN